MKRLMPIVLACLLCAITTPAQEQVAPDLKQLTAETRKLRAELLQLQLEFHEWKLSQLAREMRQLRDEQQRLADEERSFEEELAALDQQTGAGGGAQEAVSEAQAWRASSGARAQRLRARQEPLQQRLTELTAQWQREETRRQQLAQQAQRLKNAAAPQ
jgi:DNA repair exonuclease SbcCD ATPase subunit